METSLKPDKLYFKKHIYAILLLTPILEALFIPFCLYALGEKDNGTLVLMYGNIIWVILCIFILFFSKLWINNLSYIIKNNNITIYKGIFTKVEQNIPDRKVTDFILHRDLLDRFLGIGSIKVQTAGGSGQMGYEGILSGILDYKDAHKNLRDKLVNIQIPNEMVTKNTSPTNDSVLNEILSELKDLNKKIN
tara:strand:- start:690 stop:1265 length:576 start_codon:yes stop_codon:yes gene_type:complete